MENEGCFKKLLTKFTYANLDTMAFSIYDGQHVTSISYPKFAEDVLRTAGYFMEHKIQCRHIALIASNSYQWVVTFFAIITTGNVVVPLNPNLPEEILQWQCQEADVSLACYDGFEAKEKLGALAAIHFNMLCGKVPLPLDMIYAHMENEIILLMFTSGTTGTSKTVMLSSRNLFASAENSFRNQTGYSVVVDMLVLPLYHVGAIRMLAKRLLQQDPIAMGRGAKYVFMDMPKLNPTHIAMVPAMAESLVRILRRTESDKLSSYVGNQLACIIAVGAAMKSNICRILLDRGFQIDILFGMTESAGVGSWCTLDEKHIGTIGKPDENTAFRIEDGEILLKSDAVMIGYYKDPEETAKVIVDGWLHTGDMGYCDEDGYYYITGRKKNVIILSNGENVNPEEIEATFSNCDAVEECLVYSDGKGICADVFTEDRNAAAECIKQYNENMPMYRQVYKVNYTEEPLPKTGSGKIKRKENK